MAAQHALKETWKRLNVRKRVCCYLSHYDYTRKKY